MDNVFSKAFENYFSMPGDKTFDGKRSLSIHEDESLRLNTAQVTSSKEYDKKWLRHMADGNIDDIDQLADLLKQLANAAWGHGWGELSPDLKVGENPSDILLPQVLVEINSKEVAQDMAIKPTLFDTYIERDSEGNPTGDAFLLYRQFFDANIEFTIYGHNSQEAREYKNKLQKLISTYTGYLKRKGVAELYYEKEAHPKVALNYKAGTAMQVMYYYARFESITVMRKSTLDRIDVELGIGNGVDVDRINQVIKSGGGNRDIDIHFFDGDDINTYRL